MQILSPIHSKYFFGGNVLYFNQLFGEGKNMEIAPGIKYGPNGHEGVDIDTTGDWKFERAGQWLLEGERWNVKKAWYEKVKRDPQERIGRIPILACHAGEVTLVLHEDKERKGWGMYITADPELENGIMVQYRTLYWHIETPWHSLQYFDGKEFKNFPKKVVRAGAVISIAGNNGMSSGPHLHLELHRRALINGKWTDWIKLNPMPYFTAQTTYVCQRNHGGGRSEWFYRGVEKTRPEINAILDLYPKPRI